MTTQSEIAAAIEALKAWEAHEIPYCVEDEELGKHIETILTALAQQKPTEQQWRDIKDAPRDGTQFLVYSSGRVYISRPRIDNHGNNKNTYVACPKKPTHWMPLPAPPSEGEG